MTTQQELLADRIKGLEAAIDFFATGNNAELERSSVRQFLRALNLAHDKNEIVSSPDDPPDVLFRDGRFEVKEILDEGRERHREYKEALERARNASSVDELGEQFYPRDLRLSELVTRCEARLSELKLKYPPAVKVSLDLLLNVNLVDHMFFIVDEASTESFKDFGWRSISFVNGRYASCLYASPHAPGFLQAAIGRVSERVA